MPNQQAFMTNEHGLTEKQEAFCIEYVLNRGNASEAARRAGYSDSSGADAVTGYENLRNPNIIARIAQLKEDSGVKSEVTLEWAIANLVGVVERSMQREEIHTPDGMPTGVFKYDSRGVVSALKLIGEMKGWLEKKAPDNTKTPEQMLADYKRMKEVTLNANATVDSNS